jgi:amino acid transporter
MAEIHLTNQTVLLPGFLSCACCYASCRLQSRVHPKTRTPVISVLFCGAVSAVLALFVPLEELSDLTSMGALFAFCVVSAGVLFRWAGAASVLCALTREVQSENAKRSAVSNRTGGLTSHSRCGLCVCAV